mmetsp:Transcript_8054/g.10319  ORF Transcript_8054/g.10319 Transcript_8054/m.10319 type:complete len:137 (-) Transcript_8054:297-707(-)|eukprot:CAMPEP_0116058876 /NCGR_PEP_ID=MMETSP0322-20121206/5465_1 /TAXON_ID=163516 /ORGANISM="Leptocylindrus danicus var. apora, Strain B651" /LENGTH=136 /DNA_ID=CAMNT_0003543157 /DNA_START=163 /DNA_END=573 /DNA_ORIENTATION=-
MKLSMQVRVLTVLYLGVVGLVQGYGMPRSSCTDRRTAISNGLTFLGGTFAVVPTVVIADDDTFADDLSMPSEEELKKQRDADMAERLRKKAELQRKASRPMDFKESMKLERERQEGMKKDKAEKRDALCEELGRGC